MKKKDMQSFFKILIIMSMLVLFALPCIVMASTPDTAPGREMAKQATKGKIWITTNHAKHEVLKQDFTSGPEVTKACLTCHTESALQFHKTIHWTWKDPNSPKDNQLGKSGLSVNNF